MKNFILICLLLFLGIKPVYANELGDWSRLTKNKTEIKSFGSPNLILKNGKGIGFVYKWYFFKDHIIGVTRNERYIIVNELGQTIEKFDSEATWQITIKEKNLHPTLWTRWYQDNWSFHDIMIKVLVVNFYISIPLLIWLVKSIHRAIVDDKLSLKKRRPKILLLLICFLMCQFFLGLFPQSF